jgi:hypothetical protein
VSESYRPQLPVPNRIPHPLLPISWPGALAGTRWLACGRRALPRRAVCSRCGSGGRSLRGRCAVRRGARSLRGRCAVRRGARSLRGRCAVRRGARSLRGRRAAAAGLGAPSAGSVLCPAGDVLPLRGRRRVLEASAGSREPRWVPGGLSTDSPGRLLRST